MSSDSRPTVVLELHAARELHALLEDQPGLADEEQLDAALEAVRDATPTVDGSAQSRIARGHAVALGLGPRARRVVTRLIIDNTVTDRPTLQRVRDRLGGKLHRARNRRAVR